jgi:hypothetical protein
MPGIEVFSWDQSDCDFANKYNHPSCEQYTPGWYWHACMPGCLPDSDPIGPFDFEQDAIDDCLAGAIEAEAA